MEIRNWTPGEGFENDLEGDSYDSMAVNVITQGELVEKAAERDKLWGTSLFPHLRSRSEIKSKQPKYSEGR